MIKWKVKSLVKELIIGALLLFILTNIISYIRKPELPYTQVPELEVELLDGTTYKVDKGKPLVLHFWATWCPTCKLEAANIQSVSHDYEVLSIAVNSGDKATIKTYMHDRDLTFRVVNDLDGQWAEKFNVEAYPTTFIYNASGELQFTEVGYTTTAGLLARLKLAE